MGGIGEPGHVELPGGLPFEVFGWGEGAGSFNSEAVLRYLDQLEALNLMPRWFSAPLFVLWEITARCPLDCAYCYNASPKKVRELSREGLLDVADQLVAMRVFGASVSGGEPLARPDFFEVVERLAAGGVAVSTVTSGWHVDAETARRLTRTLNAITVSLDGSTAELHDTIRRRQGSFDRAVAAIRHLVDAGCRPVCSFAATPQNAHDYPRVLELCERLGVVGVRSQVLAITGKVLLHPEVAGLTVEQYLELQQIANAWNASHPNGPHAGWLDPSGHIRAGLRFGRVVGMRITAEGFLTFTPHVPYAMGDASRDRILDVWQRSLREAWRHPVVRRELEGIQSAADLPRLSALSGGDAYGYRHLAPAGEETRA